jgi:hypothetical protein
MERFVSTFAARFTVLTLAALLLAAPAAAGEKKLMHCFAFTTIDAATDADWKAFQAATDELPGKIPGLSRVWHGKLRAPLSQYTVDAGTRKKLGAGEKDVTGPVNRLVRSYGVCMEMADEATLKSYASHAAHAEWLKAYEKVRVAGTTTFDILGQ